MNHIAALVLELRTFAVYIRCLRLRLSLRLRLGFRLAPRLLLLAVCLARGDPFEGGAAIRREPDRIHE